MGIQLSPFLEQSFRIAISGYRPLLAFTHTLATK